MRSVTFLIPATFLICLIAAENCEDCGALLTLKTEKFVPALFSKERYEDVGGSGNGGVVPLMPFTIKHSQDDLELGERGGAVIFYQLYIHSEEDVARVSALVHEQLSLLETAEGALDAVAEIRINSIGAPVMLGENCRFIPLLLFTTLKRCWVLRLAPKGPA
eukprot:s4736_g5.t1